VNSVWRAFAALLLTALLAACASRPQGTVVLLPDAKGQDTAVLVKQDGGELLLDKPYAAAQLSAKGPQPATSSAEQVQARFGAALAARPFATLKALVKIACSTMIKGVSGRFSWMTLSI